MYKRLEGVLIPLVVCVPLLLWRLGTAPPVWFDEGYKMHAAYQWAFRGFYGTETVAGAIPFDPGISTGPADLLAVALAFRFLGVTVFAARLAAAAYALVLAAGIYGLVRLMEDRAPSSRRAPWATLLVLAVPPVQGVGAIATGRQVLGETAALALIVAGLYAIFRQWRAGHGLGAVYGGLLIGLGLLSKTQVAIALVPSLGVIGLARAWRRPGHRLSALAPLVMSLAVFGAWQAGTGALTPAAVRAENAVLLREALASNLLAFPWGRWLTHSAQLMFAVMLGSVGITMWRRWRARHEDVPGVGPWVEWTLSVFVLFSALWFALVSVGWPRYAYAGWIMSTVLWAWALANWLSRRVTPGARSRALTATLAAAVFVFQGAAIARSPANADAERMAAYIRTHVPPGAVLETWEWELDALSGHFNVHHPHQRYLFLATRQFSRGRPEFSLEYDALTADPHFLVVGPFGAWTGIYAPAVTAANFTEEARIGAYTLYRRMR